jgi:hypothetical protein
MHLITRVVTPYIVVLVVFISTLVVLTVADYIYRAIAG